MNISEIRQKYPQYNDMTDVELSDRLYERYYSDMDQFEFFDRVGVNQMDARSHLRPDEQAVFDQGGNSPEVNEIRDRAIRAADLRYGQLTGQSEAEAAGMGSDRMGAWLASQARGLTFGGMDEIAGKALRLLSGDQNSDVQEGIGQGATRQMQQTARETHPVTSTVAELAGGLQTAAAPSFGAAGATAGAVARAPAAVRAVAPFAGAAAAGAGYGGAYGALDTDGGDRTRGARRGAQMGAAFGVGGRAVLPALGQAVGRGAEAVGRRFAPAVSRAEDMALQGFKKSGMTLDNVASAAGTASRRGGTNAEFLGEVPQIAQKGGWTASTGQLRALANVPGPGQARVQNALRERIVGTEAQRNNAFLAGTGKRIASALTKHLPEGSNPSNYREILEAIGQQMREEAAPRYARAFQQSVDDSVFDIIRASGNAEFASIMRKASRLAGREGKGAAAEQLMRLARGERFSDLNVAAVDVVKRSLDDAYQTAQRSGAGQTARAYRRYLNNDGSDGAPVGFLRLVDEAVPDYNFARNAWATGAEMQDAMQRGLRAFGDAVDDVTADVATMGEAQRQAFLLGFSRSIVDRLAKSDQPTRAITAMLRSPNMRAVLSEVLPRDGRGARKAYHEFQRRLQREAQMIENANRITRNSITAPLQQEIAEWGGGQGLGGLVQRSSGLSKVVTGARDWVDQYALRTFDRLFARPGLYDDAVNDALTEILLAPVGSKAQKQALERLSAREQALLQQSERIERASGLMGRLGGPVGRTAAVQSQER